MIRYAQEAAAARMARAQGFHTRAQERTGVLIPLYVYPANIHQNPVYNRLIEIKRRFETVPIWVILNPDSGPGKAADANYTKAIDRLQGAGCVVLGYVTTSYSKRTPTDVKRDIDTWLKLYPKIHGLFFDEMVYEDKESSAQYQAALNRYAHDAGLWPTVANPGTDTPGRYFAAEAADVIVVHEGSDWPDEKRLKGDYFGGYSDYPPFTRAVLLHSRPELNQTMLRMARKYVRWVYVTEGPFRPNDPAALNPWDRLSRHLEALCEALSSN
ncbi:MAG: spherulation-specific family 4 protein [Armatimonas sp.]